MKKGLLVLFAMSCLNFNQPAKAESIASLGIDIYDLISIKDRDPIGYWRRLRPQDFINAPTVWQFLV